MAISPCTRECWHISEKMNKALLEHLTPEMVLCHTPAKGYSVAQHLAHMAEAKKYWGSMLNESVSALPNLIGNHGVAETNLAQIKDVFRQTSKAILEAAETAQVKGSLPYPSLDVFLTHLMVHDAHHRGQILLALKHAGHPLPDEGVLWGIWRTG